jgi:hypothetical protein
MQQFSLMQGRRKPMDSPFSGKSKVIQPKYYKHFKEDAQPKPSGKIKMDWFPADLLVHQVILKS